MKESIRLCLLFSVALLFCGCEKTKEEKDIKLETLKGTKWKLEGIADDRTGTLKVLEPKDCEECFTLTFDTNSTFSGFSTTRNLSGECNIDYATNAINISMYFLPALDELDFDAELYVRDLENVFSFSLQENNTKLILYFNDKSYFLYNKL
ncbi:MAG: hypothetical protein LBV32_09735 [Tannerellaceae bacterium]|jgi:hypothetical protein|nr:hypothetical protein [Tannerellaceae bacterium]